MLNWIINKASLTQESHAPLAGVGCDFKWFSLNLINNWNGHLQAYPHSGWYNSIKYGNVIFEFCTPYTPLHDWTEIERHIAVYIINTKICADIPASLLPFNNIESLISEFVSVCDILLIQSVHEL